MSSIPSHHDYTVGGALRADAPTYVEREADEDFYRLLKDQELCYVLNARQMGKTSLTVRVIGRLCDEGIVCASIDISTIGKSVTEEQWYLGVIRSITRSLCIHRQQFNLSAWWIEQNMLSYVQRLSILIEDILLTVIVQPVIVFIDEIDSIRSLSFNVDDFFAAIRECYNRRANNPAYRRLTFALIGSSTPSALIQNKQIAPFNIGRSIHLTGFRLEQAYPLAQGLAIKSFQPQKLLQVILNWTGGQPFLTQKLCQLVLTANSAPENGQEIEWVANLVRTKIIENWEVHDEPQHLKTICDRMLYSDQQAGRLLGLYQQLLQQGELVANDRIEQLNLRLTGIAVNQDGKLRIYNPIYAAVFNEDWVRRTLADLRPYDQALQEWLASDRKDESRLLRGQALKDAKTWAVGKSLSDQDYGFLGASEQYEAKVTLDAAKEANRILAEARRKAYWITGAAIIALVASLIVATFASQQAKLARQDANIQKEAASDAQQNLRVVEERRAEVNQQLQTTKQELSTKRQEVDLAKQQFQTARRQLTVATAQLNRAKNETQSAQQQTQEARKLADQAKVEQQNAEAKFEMAKTNLMLADVRLKSITSKALFSEGQVFLALLEALRAGQQLKQLDSRMWRQSTLSQTVAALSEALRNVSERNTLRGHRGHVTSVSFSPDSKMLASSSEDGTVKLWTVETGREIYTFEGHHGVVASVSFSPDGKIIASGGWDRTVKLWDTTTGKEIRTFGHEYSVKSVSFSPDGKTIASSSGIEGTYSNKNFVKLWDVATGKEIHTFVSDSEAVGSVSFSPNGKMLALGGWRTILWDIKTGKILRTFQSHRSSTDVAFSRDSKILAFEDENGLIKLWDVETGKDRLLSGYRSGAAKVSFGPNGAALVFVNNTDKVIKLWSTSPTGGEIRSFKGHGQTILSVRISPDGKTLASGSMDATVKLWSLSSINNVSNIRTLNVTGYQSFVNDFNFSSDNRIIATGSEDGIIKLWNAKTGKEIRSFLGHSSGVTSIKFSPDGKAIATADKSGAIKLWNLNTGDQILTFKGHSGVWVTSISFSSNGKTISSSGGDGNIKLWDIKSGREIPTLRARREHQDVVESASFSPNGKLLASGGRDHTVKLWNVETGEEIYTLTGHIGSVLSISFSPNGKILASGSWDQTIKLWNIETGKEIRTLRGGQGTVTSVSFSPDGSVIIARGWNGVVKLWETNTGNEIYTLVDNSSGTNIVKFSPDLRTIGTNSSRDVTLWNWDLDVLMEIGCHWTRSYLTVTHPESRGNPPLCKEYY